MGDGWVRERLERLYMDGASAVAEAVTTMDECTKDSSLTIIQKLEEINFSKISKFVPNLKIKVSQQDPKSYKYS